LLYLRSILVATLRSLIADVLTFDSTLICIDSELAATASASSARAISTLRSSTSNDGLWRGLARRPLDSLLYQRLLCLPYPLYLRSIGALSACSLDVLVNVLLSTAAHSTTRSPDSPQLAPPVSSPHRPALQVRTWACATASPAHGRLDGPSYRPGQRLLGPCRLVSHRHGALGPCSLKQPQTNLAATAPPQLTHRCSSLSPSSASLTGLTRLHQPSASAFTVSATRSSTGSLASFRSLADSSAVSAVRPPQLRRSPHSSGGSVLSDLTASVSLPAASPPRQPRLPPQQHLLLASHHLCPRRFVAS
jgi:hypothetical protein